MYVSANQQERLAAEPEEERLAPLQHLSANQRERLAAEPEEERLARLQQPSANQQERLAAEPEEQRLARLQQPSANQQERLAAEPEEERLAPLQHLSANQQERLAAEPEEERLAPLQQLSANQQERQNPESVEETEARLQTDKERHRKQRGEQPQLSLFEQHLVHQKMSAFHRHLATLDVSQCTTCSKGFPGLKLQSQHAECLRCCRDKHVPKLYSSTNNMDPGPVPAQLQVSTHFKSIC